MQQNECKKIPTTFLRLVLVSAQPKISDHAIKAMAQEILAFRMMTNHHAARQWRGTVKRLEAQTTEKNPDKGAQRDGPMESDRIDNS